MMRILQKHFPQIDGRMDEAARALKGYRGADLVRRIRYVRTGFFMIRIHNEQGQVIAKGPLIKTESESIRIYNEIVKAIGGPDAPQAIEKTDDFFSDLDDEEDFFSDLDDEAQSDEDEDFFSDCIELDFFGELETL